MRSSPYLLALVLTASVQGALAAGEAFPERAEVREFVAQMHEKHGFETAHLTELFRRTHPQPKAIRAIMPPRDPSIRSWQAYRSRYVEPARISGGLQFWDRQRRVLEAARTTYGVPEEIVIAILGVETLYGRNTGRFPAFATLATLAFDYPPRAALFRKELEALLLLARESGRSPLDYHGSYAGALGIPQFLPSSVRSWGVDFDGDGRVDLSDSVADAVGSVASFLSSHGWEKDGPVAVPAGVSGERIGELVEAGILPRLTPAEMGKYGVVTTPDAPQAPCALIDLVTPGEAAEYRLGFRNFYVLTRYNRSAFYAMAVYELARELREAREARPASAADTPPSGLEPPSGNGSPTSHPQPAAASE